MKKIYKEGLCKILGRSVVFSAFYADFCLWPKSVKFHHLKPTNIA